MRVMKSIGIVLCPILPSQNAVQITIMRVFVNPNRGQNNLSSLNIQTA